MFTANSAGLKYAAESLKCEVNATNSYIFTIQETHYQRKGCFEMKDYTIFETIRTPARKK